MRKLKSLASILALASAMTAGAQTLVADAAAELTGGTVISLQSRDTNGGAGYYFNGASVKSETFGENNLYVVEGNASEGLRLRRYQDGKYVGSNRVAGTGTAGAVTEVDNAANAVIFTAQSYGEGAFTLSADTEMSGTDRSKYVRFTEQGTDNILNVNNAALVPKYWTGTGGFSVWYVYKHDIVVPTAAVMGFERTGATAETVTVSVTDGDGSAIDGVTVTLVSISHNMMTSGTNVTPAILCPNKNGNSGETISLRFKLEGLPKGFCFNQTALDIHALNSGGAYQSNSDNKPRRFNVAVRCGASEEELADWGALTDIDIAAGIDTEGDVHQWWAAAGRSVTVVDGSLVVDIVVTKGTTNEGCFFGLGGLKLGLSDEIAAPEPEEFPADGACYYIRWYGNTGSYMTEEADGSLVVSSADVSQRQFWQFISTGRKHCYYIRSTATGRYVQSCNFTASSASRVVTGTEPVEYYVAASTEGSTAGYFRLTSTDCANYDNTSATPVGLNKDGSSSYIIVWHAAATNTGSYWRLEETENLYDLRPFSASSALGSPEYKYMVLSPAGQALERQADGSLAWAEQNETAAQSWYFVGESNNSTGWQVVDTESHTPVQTKTESDRWHVLADVESSAFFLRPFETKDVEGTALAVEGDSLLTFRLMRSDFARAAQIYDLPCGSTNGIYVAKATLEGPAALRPMAYPLPAASGTKLTPGTAARPSTWYTIYTACPALLAPGAEAELTFTLASGEIPAGLQAWVYFDWNRDGLFETAIPLETAGTMTTRVQVPATAAAGRGRMRLRLTENGLSGADDEVLGQTLDFTLEVASETPETVVVTVQPNDPGRGTAELLGEEGDEVRTAVAEPLGNASFVCWKEGNRIVSLTARHEVTCNRSMTLTAVFSPNTDVNTGVAGATEAAAAIEITGRGRILTVKAPTAVKEVRVFAADGRLVARAAGNEVNVGAVPSGTYIVRAVTAGADTAVKVSVK